MFVTLLSLTNGRIAERLMPEVEYWGQWKEFLADHGGMEKYSTKAEHDDRYEIFKDNMDKVKTHNAKGKSWTLGITPFADWTAEEFSAYVKKSGTYKPKPESELNFADLSDVKVASSIDWRDRGAVTPVKNQGNCGSCWSFSTTGSLEGAYYNKHGTLLSFSEQQLVDCSSSNLGCNGGSMDLAFEYTQSHPLVTESEYPYVSGTTSTAGTCKYPTGGEGQAVDHVDVMRESKDELKKALNIGPVSVAIEADKSAFQLYNGGIIDDEYACGTQLDHGVLAVGYNVMNGEEYYIVKNSWGAGWGASGYVYIATQGSDGQGVCGIHDMASYPVVN